MILLIFRFLKWRAGTQVRVVPLVKINIHFFYLNPLLRVPLNILDHRLLNDDLPHDLDNFLLNDNLLLLRLRVRCLFLQITNDLVQTNDLLIERFDLLRLISNEFLVFLTTNHFDHFFLYDFFNGHLNYLFFHYFFNYIPIYDLLDWGLGLCGWRLKGLQWFFIYDVC